MLKSTYSDLNLVLLVECLTFMPPNIPLAMLPNNSICVLSDHKTFPQKAFSSSVGSPSNFSWAGRYWFWSRGFIFGWEPLNSWWYNTCFTAVFQPVALYSRPVYWWFLGFSWPNYFFSAEGGSLGLLTDLIKVSPPPINFLVPGSLSCWIWVNASAKSC